MTVMEWNGMEWSRNPPSILTLYASPVESYGRGAWFDLFFSLNPDVREIYSCSVSFLSFLKKLKCLFTYILYITDASFAFTLRSITDRC